MSFDEWMFASRSIFLGMNPQEIFLPINIVRCVQKLFWIFYLLIFNSCLWAIHYSELQHYCNGILKLG